MKGNNVMFKIHRFWVPILVIFDMSKNGGYIARKLDVKIEVMYTIICFCC